MLDLADSARTQTNCQRTRPDFRNRQNFGTWTNRLEFDPDALNARNVQAIRVSYDSVPGDQVNLHGSVRAETACVGQGIEKPRGAMPGSVTGSLAWFWISPKSAFTALISEVEAMA
jgi:hypothetical protein